MSKADKIFLQMWYKKEIDDEDTILYKFEKERWKKSIIFRKDIETFSTYCSRFVPKDAEKWETTEFETEWLKYCSAQGHWEHIDMDISMQELKAINMKCQELRLGGIVCVKNY